MGPPLPSICIFGSFRSTHPHRSLSSTHHPRVQHKEKELWWLRQDKHDYWCAGAYLVNKTMLKPVIDRIVEPLGNGWLGVNIIAGFGGMTPRGERETCTPAYCCPKVGKTWLPEYPPPCVKVRPSKHCFLGWAIIQLHT